MREEIGLGYAQWHKEMAYFEQKYGILILSEVGVVVTEGRHGKNYRLIHDLRRGRMNAMLRLHERLVLPRLGDVVPDTLDLMGFLEELGTEALEFFSSDFKDAFKMLGTDPAERRFLYGQAVDGWFVYATVLFGIGTGPLVWCRVVAAVMRIGQATFQERCARLSCFVDDSIFSISGDAATRNLLIAQAIACWLALGARLSWKKAATGPAVQWVGALIEASAAKGIVKVTIPAHKAANLKAVPSKMLASRGMVHRDELRRLAGKGVWMGGLLPQLKPFVRNIWGALDQARLLAREPFLHEAG